MSTRAEQAFEDTVSSLAGALHHAGQALADAAASVALLASANREVLEAHTVSAATREMAEWVMRVADTQHPVTPAEALQEIAKILAVEIDDSSLPHYDVVKPDAEQGDAFQRGFDAGASTRTSLARTVAAWVATAKNGEEQLGSVLGEIAAVLEKDLKLAHGELWPLNGQVTTDRPAARIMQLLLQAKGEANPTVLFRDIARQVELLNGLPCGAIWAEGTEIAWKFAAEKAPSGDSHD